MEDERNEWDEHRAERRAKKAANRTSSLAILAARGFKVETLNEAIAHYRVDGVNFWPTTGKFYDPKSGHRDRGVFNLIKYLKGRHRASPTASQG